MWVTPYVLHFGWKHQKKHYFDFADHQWEAHFQDKVKNVAHFDK
jgi:hypothetical protein